MRINGITTTFVQLSECRRKLGCGPPGAWLPGGGATGTILTKVSPADYDTAWASVISLLTAGNGIVFAGNTVHFGQAAAYTPGAVPFASGAATMGFDAANLFWDDATNRLGLGTNAPTDPLDVNGTARFRTMTQGSVLFAGANGVMSQDNANLFWDAANARLGIGTNAPGNHLHLFRPWADVNSYILSFSEFSTSVVGGTKRASGATAGTTGPATPWNAGLISGGSYSAFHQGSGVTTGILRFIAIEVYAGKGASGTGAMAGSTCAYLQSVNLNAVGAITDCYDLYIATPVTTGAITNNYAIYQVSPTAFSFFGGSISIATATFSANFGIRLQKSYAVSGGTGTYGYYCDVTETAGAVSSGVHRGGDFNYSLAGAQNYTSTFAVLASQGQAIHAGSGTVTGLIGLRGVALKNSTGPVTSAYGVRAVIQNANATAAIGTGYGFFGETPTVTGAITTYYGLYLSAGAGTTFYGIAQVGTADVNYFAGFTAFGSASPVNTTFALFGAGTTAASSLRIVPGAAPTVPVSGDIWSDGTDLWWRDAGGTSRKLNP